MASALRKFLSRSSSTNNNNKGEKREIGQHHHHHQQQQRPATARRLLARACSTVQGYRRRDGVKICPAEGSNNAAAATRSFGSSGGGSESASAAAAAASGLLKPSSKKQGGGGGGCAAAAGDSAAHAKLIRTRRLMREFQEMVRQQREIAAPPFTVELAGDDNLYEWHVKLHRVDPDSDLYRDMRETKTPYILLSVTFPENFPFAPPFMRVVTPRIEKGFVMDGGAICMELLTPAGWASAYTVEAVVMQFSASLVKGQARIVRSKVGKASAAGNGGAAAAAGGGNAAAGKGFSRKAAEASFRSLVKTHDKYGWVTPPLADG